MLRLRTSLFALLIVVASAAGCDRGDHPHALDKAAPDFTVSDGLRTVHLADYRGKVVLLNFWFSSCPPCLEELPSLEALHQHLPQVVILAVSVDEDPEEYRAFLQRHPLTFVTVDDPEKRVNALYGTQQFPETYVIDRNGLIRRKFISAQQWNNPEIVNYLSHL